MGEEAHVQQPKREQGGRLSHEVATHGSGPPMHPYKSKVPLP